VPFLILVDHDWQFATVFIACELDQFIQLWKVQRNNLSLSCKFDLFVRAMAHTGLRITLQLQSDTQVLPVGVQRGSLYADFYPERDKSEVSSAGFAYIGPDAFLHPSALGALRTIAERPLPTSEQGVTVIAYFLTASVQDNRTDSSA
jgi:hypothetical protein